MTRSGGRSRILSIFADVKAETRGLLRTSFGRQAKPETPTTRASSPKRYKVSTVSSVRQTMRRGAAARREICGIVFSVIDFILGGSYWTLLVVTQGATRYSHSIRSPPFTRYRSAGTLER